MCSCVLVTSAPQGGTRPSRGSLSEPALGWSCGVEATTCRQTSEQSMSTRSCTYIFWLLALPLTTSFFLLFRVRTVTMSETVFGRSPRSVVWDHFTKSEDEKSKYLQDFPQRMFIVWQNGEQPLCRVCTPETHNYGTCYFQHSSVVSASAVISTPSTLNRKQVDDKRCCDATFWSSAVAVWRCSVGGHCASTFESIIKDVP